MLDLPFCWFLLSEDGLYRRVEDDMNPRLVSNLQLWRHTLCSDNSKTEIRQILYPPPPPPPHTNTISHETTFNIGFY